MQFASDNRAGVCPEVLEAIVQEAGHVGGGYGEDVATEQLSGAFSEVFEREVWAYPVLTGTAANSLALATLCDPWGGVICSPSAHILEDECGAPEFFGGGLRLVPVGDGIHPLDPSEVGALIDASGEHDVHNTPLQVLSFTNLSERGRSWTSAASAELAAAAHDRGLAVHLDGARFANAVVGTGASPADLTWRAGVDVLSFGGTKNGALAAEAVIFFTPDHGAELERRRKRGGQLFSKMRFVSVQLLAQVRGDAWLRHASHANAMAARLADGLGAPAPDGNELFVPATTAQVTAWRAEGADFYDSPSDDGRIIRLVTSWSTTADEVDEFVLLARKSAHESRENVEKS